MSKKSIKTYDKKYYDEYNFNKTENSDKNIALKASFEKLADYIVNTINPKTVLDIGCCTMGYLVEELRNRGVQAYGLNVSKCEVSNKGKKYCVNQSVLEPFPAEFPKKFDLIVSLNAIEHLSDEDGQKMITIMCTNVDDIIFSSMDSKVNDKTVLNVQSAGYWAKNFSKRGFFRNKLSDVSFISSECIRYTKENHTIPQLVQNYEQILYSSSYELQNVSKINIEFSQQIEKQTQELELLREENKNLDFEVQRLEFALGVSEKQMFLQNKKLQKLNDDVNRFQTAYLAVVSSGFWKITSPIRKGLDSIKTKIAKIKIKHLLAVAINTIRRNGIAKTAEGYRHHMLKDKAGKLYLKKNIPTAKELEAARNTKFENEVKISILVPLYNTPENFLREMIQSVLDQSYSNWELCLADGSDDEHKNVGQIVDEYVQKDDRIIYKNLDENLGIAENTNKCIEMATGEYIALFDHDDLLHQSALFEVVKAINEQKADFIYTDDASFEGEITNPKFIHFKPDFSPDTLRSYNYICHLAVFSRALLDEVGYFSKNYDGSQDYDIILRLTEKAKKIAHISRVLYYWRVHAASVASDIEAKPYCVDSAKKAIKDHLKRLSINCEVEDSFIPTTYKIKYEILGNPLISIVIPNKDHIADLQKCILSIINKSTYKNYEIIIVENNSELEETFEYYKSISNRKNIKVAYYEGDFNYSLINNFALDYCNGEHILLLNNDVEVITPDWLEEMLMFSQREDVGAVGAKLLYPDDTIQHAGAILGINGVAGHAHKGWVKDWGGYAGRITLAQNLSAVTAACLMIKKSIFKEIDGLDPTFAVAFNDIDFCLKVRDKGYLIVYTPYAELYHYESKSRGYEDTKEKQKRFMKEVLTFQKKWKKVLADGDPYYNKNLTLKYEDFSIKI